MDTPVDFLFVGTNKNVAALDAATGALVWKTDLPNGGPIVTLLLRDDALFAASLGYAYRLDRRSGAIIWTNDLKGMGFAAVTLAADGAWPALFDSTIAAQEAQQAKASD